MIVNYKKIVQLLKLNLKMMTRMLVGSEVLGLEAILTSVIKQLFLQRANKIKRVSGGLREQYITQKQHSNFILSSSCSPSKMRYSTDLLSPAQRWKQYA